MKKEQPKTREEKIHWLEKHAKIAKKHKAQVKNLSNENLDFYIDLLQKIPTAITLVG